MGRLYLRGSGISPRGKSPKFAIVGALENCRYDSVGTTLKQELASVREGLPTYWFCSSSKVLI